ncbi:DUF2336 domain-containing protein [Phenylobacterium sp. LH3H17]|uniref:DUF2336 domain-containing protein n=1 Tax=Phenylobacterium sp. LH3H17 TaxID=2903901 RepID=UPI0020C9A784|nr:DUF2336 domain-containing protein [Phenylobacterium sp. LH3H17]UTP38741.1 DUF2336 domain-containing protein [Phenylobacterium sp. LH3H17]
MNQAASSSEQDPASDAAQAFRARAALLKRMADVVCLPSSRVNAFERSMTADLLVDMLREAEPEERKKVARRLATLSEIPASLVRLLLRDHVDVAEELLVECPSLSDADLLDCIRLTDLEHRRLVALRRGVNEVVCDVLIEFGEIIVIECLLKNDLARLSNAAIEAIVALTRGDARLTAALLRRSELRPAHAYVLFWWADAETRRTILQRFAVSREVLQEATGDIFALAAAEGWQDPLSRKALQFIERRQRNRAAIDKSPFDSLEAAVAAAQDGLTREIAEEISYLSGLKPMTGAKIFTDPGGEPLAILCKATGLPRQALRALWRGLKRPETEDSGALSQALERVMTTYDMIAVDRAQTVLRYWNWSLTSALTPALLKAIRDGDVDGVDEYSAPQRAAMLALSKEFGR